MKKLLSVFRWDKAFARKFLVVALPIVIQNLVQSSLHIIDGVMIGQLGDAPYAAVTQANRFTFVFQLFLYGVASGCGILMSQYWGKKDTGMIRQVMGLGFRLAMLLVLIFGGLALLAPRSVITLFLPQGESFEHAVTYLTCVAPGYLIQAMDNVYSNAMKSTEQTRIPMIAGVISILTNTFLNWVMIYGNLGFPALGVQGAAMATVIAAFVSMAINIGATYYLRMPSAATPKDMKLPDKATLKRFLLIITPVVFNEGLWSMGMTMYGVFYGRLGDAAVSAMGIYNTLDNLIFVMIYGIMSASAILVGSCLGAGDKDAAWLTAKRMLSACVAVGLVMGAVLLGVRGHLVGFFKVSAQAQEKAYAILTCAAFFIWLRAINTINIVGVLRAGGDTFFSMMLDTCALWLIGVPLVGIAALALRLPIEQVFIFTYVEEAVKACIGLKRFLGRKWMHVLTESGD